MRVYQQLIVFTLLLQLFVISCWARTRSAGESWPAPSAYWNELEEIESGSNTDNDLFDRSAKAKKSLREDRRKKFLADAQNYQAGHSLQGLWAMPGRRR